MQHSSSSLSLCQTKIKHSAKAVHITSSNSELEWQNLIPEEILVRIFAFLSPLGIIRAASTCHAWYRAAFSCDKLTAYQEEGTIFCQYDITDRPKQASSQFKEAHLKNQQKQHHLSYIKPQRKTSTLGTLRSLSDSAALWRFNTFGFGNGEGDPFPASMGMVQFLESRSRFGYIEQVSLEGCPNVTDDIVVALCNALPGLLRLNIACCTHITDAALRAIAAQLKHLCVLSIRSSGRYYQTTLHTLFSSCKDLQFLDAGFVQVSDNVLATLSCTCHSLKHLYLRGNHLVTPTGISALQSLSQLVYLCLRDCRRVTWRGVSPIISTFSKLTALDLRNSCHDATPDQMTSLFHVSSLLLFATSQLLLKAACGFTLQSQHYDGFKYVRLDDDGLPYNSNKLFTFQLAFSPSPASIISHWLDASSQIFTTGFPHNLELKHNNSLPESLGWNPWQTSGSLSSPRLLDEERQSNEPVRERSRSPLHTQASRETAVVNDMGIDSLAVRRPHCQQRNSIL
eukprot:gene7012-404_t